MKKVMLKTTLSLAVTFASSQLFAAGFALNEQSISGMGTGFAGRSSSAEDASTVYGNPAGMSRIKREQVSFGAAAIIAKTDLKQTGGNSTGTNDGDMVPFVGVPMGYYVKPIDDHWAFGFGMYAPFGLVTDYESGFAGRFSSDKSHVQVVTLQPTVSYAFNDRVSIGFGPTINHIKGELTSSLTGAGPFPEGRVKIKGDDTAVGFNAGLLVQATDSTRVGLTYHSKVKYKLEGDTRVNFPLGAALGTGTGGKFDASLSIDTPEIVDLSVTHELNDDWTLYAGSTFTRWSRLKSIIVENEGGGAFANIAEEQNWHDTWAHAIGAAYKLNKQWTLRTGLSVDQSPTNNTDRSTRIPTGDRVAISFGAGWSPTDDITIDVAYSYLKEEEVSVNRTNTGNRTYQANYKNSAHGIGSSLTYRF
ncbi:OmpP1/FadL family transporter [Pseudomonas sp. nanlin1]|uniref:OmpP1/FadL family transporter n=1 Tax=Pseudomonas sp. nanlin1 TaxID=3040605 RepID=UPI00388E275A